MNMRMAVGAALAVAAIAIVASTNSSSEAAPRCDGPHPPRNCATATPPSTPTPTPTQTDTPTLTPTTTNTPTPTRIPGLLDVEVGLGVSEHVFIAHDRQPFAITLSLYNHGDNVDPKVVSIEISLSSKSGIRFSILGTNCPSSSTHRWAPASTSTSAFGNETLQTGMKVQAPGLYRNGGPYYMASCTLLGYFTDVVHSDVVTIQAVLGDTNGNPTTDGNNSNNTAVEVVEVVIP